MNTHINAASEFDTAPLGWVKPEIDQALQRATEALTQFAGSNDLTRLKFARTHLHQAHGALAMLGLDGVTQLTESLEALLVLLEEQASTAGSDVFDAFDLSLSSLQQYLETLTAGQPNQPLRLWPAYQALAIARGQTGAHPADLFYPELSARAPRRESSPTALSDEALKALVKGERARYQKALLTWLKKPEEAAAALAQLRSVVEHIEQSLPTPAERTFWWVAQGFFDSLQTVDRASDPRARQLCSHIDGQLRRLSEGTRTVAERLLREALYFIAQAALETSGSETLQQINTAFGLTSLLPIAGDAPSTNPDPADSRLRDLLAGAQASWQQACAGSAGALHQTEQGLSQAAQITTDRTGTDFKRLLQASAALVHWLQADPRRQQEESALEGATALGLLLVAASPDAPAGSEFAQLVDVMVDRLYACMAGRPCSEHSFPLLDDLARRAQDQLVTGQIARDMRNQLVQVEQTLDAFFRDPAQRGGLVDAEAGLRQITASLARLGHFAAANRMKACANQLQVWTDSAADTASFPALAQELSLLGFFIEALAQGELSFDAFLQRHQLATPVSPTETAVTSSEQDAEVAGETPAKPVVPAPSAETVALAAAGSDAIDAELLGIFLGEAREVLARFAEQLTALHKNKLDTEALALMRRGTHTLKGSGRMVGLKALGETAWEIEQTLNLWLRQEQAVSSALLDLLDLEFSVFSDWLVALEDQLTAPDPQELIARAQALRLPENTPEITSTADLTDPKLLATAAALSELLTPTVQPPGGQTVSATLYDIFRDEAREHLQTLVDHLVALQTRPNGPTPFAMTRAAHTLAGTAATVGILPINQLALALESALLRRDGAANPAHPQDLATLAQVIACLVHQYAALSEEQAPEAQPELLAALANSFAARVEEPAAVDTPAEAEIAPPVVDSPTAVHDPVLEEATSPPLADLQDELDAQLLPLFLDEAQDQLPAISQRLAAWRKAPEQTIAPYAIARLLHTFKGNARMAGALALGEFTHALETRVEAATRAGECTPELIDEIEAACDHLAQQVEQLRGQMSADAQEITPNEEALADDESDKDSNLRVSARLIDQLVNEAGELSLSRTRIDNELRQLKTSLNELTDNVERLRKQLRDIEIAAEAQMQAGHRHDPASGADFDPLELDRFTRFQELTRFMAESVDDVATVQQNLLKNLDDANAALSGQARLNRSLQQSLLGIRMLPFSSQVERLQRIVRQTAKAVGKQAQLTIEGSEVELDRSVLERLLAPLEHMLRNALTHGIETQAVRQQAGKPECGEISLTLAQEGNEIILTLADDGRGLDLAAIRQRAETQGLIEPDQALDPAQLGDLIFQPGFSTATELTQVSGRGIGMDVVRTEISALGGRIAIDSQSGRGTTFRLCLPLTLAVTQTLLLRTGKQRYAVPSTLIEQALELPAEQRAETLTSGQAEWLGHRYACHYLPALLGEGHSQPENNPVSWLLFLRSGNQRVAIVVDELQGNQEVVVKNIGAQLARVIGIDGATVMADGRIVLILNPVALASRPQQIQITPPPAEPAGEPGKPLVLVVDDSLTVRKFTTRLLEREGYRVALAKDGEEALQQLALARPRVVLSDIEMPRMDGFELIRRIRTDEALKTLPIIVITSRTADKHRNHGLGLGADHYLGKPYNEAELLSLLKQLPA